MARSLTDGAHAMESLTRRQRVRAVVASTIGTTVEWYDFLLYGSAASLYLGPLFFPAGNPFLSTLAAFGSFFVGFAARPVGAALFGHFGDRVGRKAVLVATLILMGVSTFLIGLVPTYSEIGVAGGVVVTLLRVAQGLGVGGEWGGSVLLSVEWGERQHRGLLGSFPQLGSTIGLYGPQAAFIAETFTGRLRYSGASLGYHLAALTTGGPAPIVALFLLQRFNSSTPIALYVMAAALVSFVAAALLRDRSAQEITAEYDLPVLAGRVRASS